MIDIIDSSVNGVTAEWLAERPTYIGASEVGIVCGMSRYPDSTPLTVYLSKCEGYTLEDNEHMEAGRWNEPIIIARATAKLRETEPGLVVIPNAALFRHPDLSYVGCTPDALVGDDGLIEAKNTSHMMTEPDPLHVAQVVYQLGTTGRTRGWLAYLCEGWKLVIFEIAFDIDLYTDMVEAVVHFWNTYIVPRIPPEPTNAADVLLRYPRHAEGKVIEAADEVVAMLHEYATHDANEKDAKAKKDAVKERLQMTLGDAEAFTRDGQQLATWKASKDSTMLDTDALKRDFADVYAACQKPKPGVRTFNIKRKEIASAAMSVVTDMRDAA